jgi:hypothetical protein
LVSVASLAALTEKGFALWANDEIVEPVLIVQNPHFELLKYRAADRTAPRGDEQSHEHCQRKTHNGNSALYGFADSKPY